MSVSIGKPPTKETSGPATNPNSSVSSLIQSWRNYSNAEMSAAANKRNLTPAQLNAVASGAAVVNGPSSSATGGPPITYTGHAGTPTSYTPGGTTEYSVNPYTAPTGTPTPIAVNDPFSGPTSESSSAPASTTTSAPTSTTSALTTPKSVAGLSLSPLVIVAGVVGIVILAYLLTR